MVNCWRLPAWNFFLALHLQSSSFLAVTSFSMLCGCTAACILGTVFAALWRLCATNKHFPRKSVFSLLVGIALNICPFCLCSLSIMAGMLHTCDSMHSLDLEEAVSELLSHLDLEHAALTGDLTILRELQHAECIDKIHDVNKMYKFTAEEWESERVSHSPAVPSLTLLQDCTALMIAAWSGHTEVVEILLHNHYNDVNAQDSEMGLTALTMACIHDHRDIVQALLHDSRLAVNLADRDGWTALMYAAYMHHTSALQGLLRDARTDVNLTTQVSHHSGTACHCLTPACLERRDGLASCL